MTWEESFIVILKIILLTAKLEIKSCNKFTISTDIIYSSFNSYSVLLIQQLVVHF